MRRVNQQCIAKQLGERVKSALLANNYGGEMKEIERRAEESSRSALSHNDSFLTGELAFLLHGVKKRSPSLSPLKKRRNE